MDMLNLHSEQNLPKNFNNYAVALYAIYKPLSEAY